MKPKREMFAKVVRCIFIENGILILFIVIVLLIGYIFANKGIASNDNNIRIIYMSIGTSLIATGIVAFLDIWRSVIKRENANKIDNVIVKAGIDNVFSKRDLDVYDSLMNDLSHSVDITGYSLRSFYDSYSDLIRKKVASNGEIKIRVIVVDPDSIFSTNRELVEGSRDGEKIFKPYIERIEADFRKSENIEVRRISTPLSTMIFRIDDVMFVGPHLHRKTSKSTFTFELNKTGWLFTEYQDEFNRLWKDGKEV